MPTAAALTLQSARQRFENAGVVCACAVGGLILGVFWSFIPELNNLPRLNFCLAHALVGPCVCSVYFLHPAPAEHVMAWSIQSPGRVGDCKTCRKIYDRRFTTEK